MTKWVKCILFLGYIPLGFPLMCSCSYFSLQKTHFGLFSKSIPCGIHLCLMGEFCQVSTSLTSSSRVQQVLASFIYRKVSQQVFTSYSFQRWPNKLTELWHVSQHCFKPRLWDSDSTKTRPTWDWEKLDSLARLDKTLNWKLKSNLIKKNSQNTRNFMQKK